MADQEKRIDLVQRYTDKMRRGAPPPGLMAGAVEPPHDPDATLPDPTLASRTLADRTGKDDMSMAEGVAAAVAAASVRPPREARIDLTALARSGHLTPKTMRTRLAEEFRVIKRPLLLKASARGEHAVNSGNLIMVTSARPREGKTFTAINLAMSMASERDMAVLMVDISPRRDMCAQLGVASDRGLFEALVDPRMTLDEVTVRTNIPNLSVLPGGIEHAHATELLASQRMADLARELSSSDPGRMVVFDAPPVLASSVPSVLALYVGQTVVVVEKDSTSRNAVERALVLLQPCKDVCFVLNKAKFAFDSDRFGSYSAADGDAER